MEATVFEQLKKGKKGKLCYIYTMKFYTAIRKKEILSFMTAWMDLESVLLSEASQSEKDKYMISLICGN